MIFDRTRILPDTIPQIILALCCFVALSCSSSARVRNDAKIRKIDDHDEKTFVYTESLADKSPQNIENEPPLKALLNIAVISDMNGNYGSCDYSKEVIAAVDTIIEQKPDLVLNLGDMIAGQKNNLDYDKMWGCFHAAVTEKFENAGIPMAQVVGNHDGSAYPEFAVERETYLRQWTDRRSKLNFTDDTAYPLYYSFEMKNIHFVALDISTLNPIDEPQYLWLENTLKTLKDKQVVVFFHVPLFGVSWLKYNESVNDPRLAPLFEENNVDLVLTGHQHAYYPAHRNGVHYLHAGALGGGPRSVRNNGNFSPKTLTFVKLYKERPPYFSTKNYSTGKDFDLDSIPAYMPIDKKLLIRKDIAAEDAEMARDYDINPNMPKNQFESFIRALKIQLQSKHKKRVPTVDWTKLVE